jgi:signal transduction histidine kinase
MTHTPFPLVPTPAASPTRRQRWRVDLAVVLAATFVCYGLSVALELNEWMSLTLAHYERWQADELPLTLTVLTAGMAWFALRRRQEVQAELQLRARAEASVTELLRQNRELARRLMSLQESERRALARDLHDEVGQACSAIRVELAFIRHCDSSAHQGIGPAAERAEGQALRLYTLVHDMLNRLRPVNLETLGLVAAVQELCESWEERTGVSCVFHHEGLAQPLGDAIDIAVYRVTQEALTNVTRHAQASAVRVRLSCAADALSLAIQDDGHGVDPARPSAGLGLLGASERAASLGGVLTVTSEPGAGMRVVLTLPLLSPLEPAEGAK